MRHCQQTIGSQYFKTPRETVRSFVNLLSLIEQYPHKGWQDFIEHICIHEDINPGDSEDADDLVNFKL